MDIEKIYKDSNALLKGHFLLSSGKHSEYYLQSAKVLENPKTAHILVKELANKIKKKNIKADFVCSPALGGLICGYELARTLGINFIFTERVNSIMCLRRGFEIKENAKFIICEDIITTGGSALEVAKIIRENKGKVVAYASIANRGFCKSLGEKNDRICKLEDDVEFITLKNFHFNMYEKEDCPWCKKGSKAIKPGSR